MQVLLFIGYGSNLFGAPNNSANTKYDPSSGLFGTPDFEPKQQIGDFQLSLLEGKTREW